MRNNAVFYFTGSDLRSQYAAEALRIHGCHVAEQDPGQADVIVLPMGGKITQEFLSGLRPGQVILGGNLGPGSALLREEGLQIYDYYADPLLQCANAVPTAEGAIGLLMEHLPVTLQGSRFLITGYGRIGSLLSGKLLLLGAKVTASARKDADLGRIFAAGMRAEYTGHYRKPLDQYDAVINTVPAAVFSTKDYAKLRPDCLLLELASDPGGFDDALCRAHGLQCVRAPGLPGKCAPKTAGYAIADAILRLIELEESS